MKILKIFWLLPVLAFIQLLSLFHFHFNHKFHPKDFAHGFSETYSRNVSEQDLDSLKGVLNQNFYYLGSGKQMAALESEDHQYVLKLFNPMRPLKKKWYTNWKYWQRYCSIKWISREWFHKNARLKKLFDRHEIAYGKMREEAGLIFLHFSPSEQVNQKISVRDNQGKKHILDLRKTPFVLQRKATLVPQYLNRLIQLGELEKAKRAVASMEKLFEKRFEEGITDRIQTMENNYGFVGENPIQIDVGRIRLDPQLQQGNLEEKKRILENFQTWIQTHYPALL